MEFRSSRLVKPAASSACMQKTGIDLVGTMMCITMAEDVSPMTCFLPADTEETYR